MGARRWTGWCPGWARSRRVPGATAWTCGWSSARLGRSAAHLCAIGPARSAGVGGAVTVERGADRRRRCRHRRRRPPRPRCDARGAREAATRPEASRGGVRRGPPCATAVRALLREGPLAHSRAAGPAGGTGIAPRVGHVSPSGRARPSSSPVVSCSRARSPTATARSSPASSCGSGSRWRRCAIVGDRPDDLDGRAAVRRRGGRRADRHLRRARADGRRPHRRGRRRRSPARRWSWTRTCGRTSPGSWPGGRSATGSPGPRWRRPTASRRWCRAGAVALAPVGTAPGLVVQRPGGPLVVVLPGPPRELTGMWPAALASAPVAALLAATPAAESRELRYYGLPESEIAATLRELGPAGPVRRRGDHLPAPLRAGGRHPAAARLRGRRDEAARRARDPARAAPGQRRRHDDRRARRAGPAGARLDGRDRRVVHGRDARVAAGGPGGVERLRRGRGGGVLQRGQDRAARRARGA